MAEGIVSGIPFVPTPVVPIVIPWQAAAGCAFLSLIMEWVDIFITYDSCQNKCKESCVDCVNTKSALKFSAATLNSVGVACSCLGIPLEWLQTLCLQFAFAKWVRDSAIIIHDASIARENCEENISCSTFCVPFGPPYPFVEE